MLLLPFLLLALAVDAVVCIAGGFGGWMLPLMAVAVFIAAFVGSLLAFVLVLGVISLFIDKSKEQSEPSPFARAVVVYVVGLINKLLRVRIHTEGFEQLPEGRWLYVSNHRSAFDALTACWALREYGAAFIMKPGIMKIPIAGRFLHKACFLAIDRENDREALKTIIRATQLIKKDMASIAVYPEGTRSHRGEGLLPFRNGVFKIAQRAKVPVVVATVKNSENVLRNFPWRPTDVYLKVCKVIDADAVVGLKTNEIGDEARTCMMLEGC